MHRFIFVLVLFFLSHSVGAKHPQDCGMFNGARCSAEAGHVTWSFGPDVWYHYDNDFNAPQLADPPEWHKKKDPWPNPSTMLIRGPEIDLPKVQMVVATVEIALDLEAPFDDRSRQDHKGQLMAEYPAFAVNIELSSGDENKPFASDRIDLSPTYQGDTHGLQTEDICLGGNTRCSRKWKLQNGFQSVTLSFSPSSSQQPLKGLQLVAWAANRLNGSGLKGTVKFRNAKIQIIYEHPTPENASYKARISDIARVSLATDNSVLNCQEVIGEKGIGGGYYTSCFIHEGKIEGLKEKGKRSVYDVEYHNTCTGTPLSVGVLNESGNFAEFIQGNYANATVVGVAPLLVVDAYGSAYSEKAIVHYPCRIDIKHVYIRALDDYVSGLQRAHKILDTLEIPNKDGGSKFATTMANDAAAEAYLSNAVDVKSTLSQFSTSERAIANSVLKRLKWLFKYFGE